MSQSVYQIFSQAADARSDAPFLIVPSGRGDGSGVPDVRSFGDVRADVAVAAACYRHSGIGHGHSVAVQLGNRPEFFTHFLALNSIGAAIVPINPDYKVDEIRFLLEHSEAVLAVVTPEMVEIFRQAGAALGPGGCGVPVIDGLGCMPFVCPELVLPVVDIRRPGTDSVCALLYTSGTTGRPKGCMLSNAYFLAAGACYLGHGGLITLRPGAERFYNPLPLFHMNHLAVTATAAMLTGNALVLTERFSPSRWWDEIVETGATIIHYLGIVAPTLLNQPPSLLERRHRVRFGFGAGVEPQLHGVFEERFGFPLVEVWGMTETGRVLCANIEPRQIHTRAFGRAIDVMEARVVDELDRAVPDGVEGELVVRYSEQDPRQGFFLGYLKDAQATEDAWRGGWFHSGDVVRRDETGMFYFVDRKKNIIRRSGENIAAAEIEAVLQAHGDVAQVAVVAAPDEVREEEVFACVVLMSGVVCDAAKAEELVRWCGARLAYFKIPGWVLFLEALPTTGTQKVQKAKIFAAGEDPRRRPGVVDMRSLKRRDAF